MRHNNLLPKWIIRMIVFVAAVLILYMALEVTVISEYRYRHGLIYAGAEANCIEAMNRGDSTNAIRWAQRMIDLTSGDYRIPEHRLEAYHCLACSYEIAGQYEQAMQVHNQHRRWPRDEGRVYYKLGDNAKAFEAFCQFVVLEKRRLKLTLPLDRQSARVRTFFDRVNGGYFSYEKAMWPFRSYEQFLHFMRREWKDTDNHEDYREAMELLESLASSPNVRKRP